MIETPQRLYPDTILHHVVAFQGTKPELRAVRSDLLDIYDPGKGKWARRLQLAEGSLELGHGRKNDTRPDFSISMRFDYAKDFRVTTGDLSVPGHAAGWAVLHLYREVSSGLKLESLTAVDPVEASIQRYTNFLFQGLDEAKDIGDVRDMAGASLDTKASLENQGLHIVRDPERSGSMVYIKNELGASLLDMLLVVHEAYDHIYPTQKAETSSAVAGIVGAGNMDDFQAAWNEAREAETAVIAGRTLLESGVFLDQTA